MTSSLANDTALFSQLNLRGVTLKNRIAISPMSQYRAVDGVANDWHLVHLGQFALGGAAIVFTEAVSVEPRGRSTLGELGIWTREQTQALSRVAGYIKAQGAIPGIQFQHAGRKGSVRRPWHGRGPLTDSDRELRNEAGFKTVAPSAVAFDDDWPVPHELTEADLAEVKRAYAQGARNAAAAGFEVLELHAAHGYLLHSFLSPFSNFRTDGYGGDFDGRSRFVLELLREVRAAWPDDKPLFVRINVVDLEPGGWSLEDSIRLCKLMQAIGVDVADCSNGGATGASPRDVKPAQPGFRAVFSRAIKEATSLRTMIHGLILHPRQADSLIRDGATDIVAIARTALFDPYWPRHAHYLLSENKSFADWPTEYGWWLERWDSDLRALNESPFTS